MILIIPGMVHAQAEFSYSFRDVSLLDAVRKIEQDSKMTFYYAENWLDTLKITKEINENDLENVLTSLFQNTKIYFHIYPDRVILTYNSPIIKQSYDSKDKREDLTYVYSKEYVEDSKNEEDRTFEIGDKALLSRGGVARLSGFIRESESNIPVAGAVIYLPNTSYAAVADEKGFYSLNLPRGLNTIRIQFTGMKTAKRKIILYSSGSLNIELVPDIIMLDDVLLLADRDENIRGVTMGVDKFDLREMKNVPKILGENDIVQIALTMPGVQNVGEGSGGINVRGGKVDQNLMLLNQATIYNPFHFFGFFSSFNADVIGEAELYKSSIPVQFGGRLSSVFDVKMKEGSKEKLTVQGGISPVTTRLAIEAPLIKDKTSVTLGLRGTYSDWVLNFVDQENISNSSPFFIDAAFGLDHTINEKNKVAASVYWSRDEYKLTADSLFSYDNLATSINWNSRISDRLLGTFTATLSTYDFNVDYDGFPETDFNFGSEIMDWGVKADMEYELNENHKLRFGAESKYYELNPGSIRPLSPESGILEETLQEEKALEYAFFLSDEWAINDVFSVSAGLRYSGYSAFGPRETFIYEEGLPRNQSTVIDTVSLNSGSFQYYGGLEYRLGARFSLNSFSSIKLGANRTRQYIHILSNNVSLAPTDTWKLSDNYILPQIADQISAGYFHNLLGENIEMSVEMYYKRFHNLLDYKTGANLALNQSIESDVLQGEGFSYGVEFLIKKKTGNLNGWIGYTYSRSKQRFSSQFSEETINNGEYFPTNFDKPHVFSLVGNYKITRRYSFSLNVNYSTGRPVTYPTGKFIQGNTEVVLYSDRNKFRLPDYFRVDLGLNIEGNHKLKKLAHGFWTISVYNLFGRDNVYSIFFVPEDGVVNGYQLSIFAEPIPTITYNFRF